MEDKLQTFRQPMVTATGIILGFVLNFASSWVKTESPLDDLLAYFVGTSVLIGTVSLIMVLYRILNMSYPRSSSESYYRTTLRLFIFGIGMAYLGVLVDMFANFMHD
ncbi:MAG: hypothetical protein JNN12_06870 [Bacteroidetes Order II. Incertae sedis bacterium]|nr:hypothetical protein [Bacteroidetes Order II. bacterium]